MNLRISDSLDTIEFVMTIEEVFELDFADFGSEFGGPAEIVNWLEANLSTRRPNKNAADMLRRIAKRRQRPELATGLDGTWRREQIAAITEEIVKD